MSAVRLWRDDMGPVRDPCWYVQAAGGTTEWVALPAAEFEALVARARSSGCSECRRGECSCEEYAVERERDEARALLAQRSEQHAALVALLRMAAECGRWSRTPRALFDPTRLACTSCGAPKDRPDLYPEDPPHEHKASCVWTSIDAALAGLGGA